MNPIFICDGRLLNVPSAENLILVISSAAASDSAVRLRLRLTYGRHDYPSSPSDGCVSDDIYLPFIYFLVPTAVQFHVKPTTAQQFVRLSLIILIASSQPAHLCTIAEQSRKTIRNNILAKFVHPSVRCCSDIPICEGTLVLAQCRCAIFHQIIVQFLKYLQGAAKVLAPLRLRLLLATLSADSDPIAAGHAHAQ